MISQKQNSMAEDKKEGGSNYLSQTVVAIIIIAVVKEFWPHHIPFDIWQVWETKGTMNEWMQTASYITLSGVILSTLFYIFKADTIRSYELRDRPPIKILIQGFLISVWAGVVEEIAFRWLLFYAGIVTVKIANFILLGFIGLDIVQWLHNNLFGPIANITTLGYLESYLFHPSSWAVGASILATNATFRDGHLYQGVVGWIHSWIFGMIMFYMLFTYGLIACIVVHFSYDMVIFTLSAILTGIHRTVRKIA